MNPPRTHTSLIPVQFLNITTLVLALLCTGQSAQAQTTEVYPNKPITVIIPMAAGGTADLLVRKIIPELSKRLGQNLIIDNRVGANGAIGEDFVSRAKPDGYTLMAESSSIASNPWMMKLNYDPLTAFTPVIKLASVPLVLIANSNVNVKSVKELTEFAKKNPGKLNYASWGNGSTGNFAGEIFKIGTGTQINHVPYKSTSQAINDALAGQVDLMFPTLPLSMQHLKAGKIRALAVMSSKRAPELPDVPSTGELGFPNMEVESWFGFFFPANTPAEIITKINTQTNLVLKDPELRAALESAGFRISGGTQQEFAKYYRAESSRYEELVKLANMKDAN